MTVGGRYRAGSASLFVVSAGGGLWRTDTSECAGTPVSRSAAQVSSGGTTLRNIMAEVSTSALGVPRSIESVVCTAGRPTTRVFKLMLLTRPMRAIRTSLMVKGCPPVKAVAGRPGITIHALPAEPAANRPMPSAPMSNALFSSTPMPKTLAFR